MEKQVSRIKVEPEPPDEVQPSPADRRAEEEQEQEQVDVPHENFHCWLSRNRGLSGRIYEYGRHVSIRRHQILGAVDGFMGKSGSQERNTFR